MKNIVYTHHERVHNEDSAKEVVPYIVKLLNPQSVIDVGCGLGEWLRAFQLEGVQNIKGIDGEWVPLNKLKIPQHLFEEKNLTEGYECSQKYDLAICLEVAEHLPHETASVFVKSLTSTSDVILFSAAIPHQGGQNHINEQWQEYWRGLFREEGYYFHDALRAQFWDNENIFWWYKQNMFLVSKEFAPDFYMRNAVHPSLFESVSKKLSFYEKGELSLRIATKLWWQTFRQFLKRRIFR